MRVAIAFDDSLARYGGVQTYIKTLAGQLRLDAHEVHLVSSAQATRMFGCTHHAVAPSPTFRFNGSELSLALPFGAEPLRQLVAEGYFDVLHVQLPQLWGVSGSLVRAAPLSTAVVGTCSSVPYGSLNRRLAQAGSFALRRAIRRLDGTIAISRLAAGSAEELWGCSARHIPAPVELPTQSEFLQRSDETQRLVFVGSMGKRKGLATLLRAFAALGSNRSHPPAVLDVVGDGRNRVKYQAIAERLGLARRAIFHGAIANEQRDRLLTSATWAVFPSWAGESFGYVIPEAIACSTPVLATDIAGYRETLAGRTGAIKARDVRTLAAALDAALELPESLREKEWRSQSEAISRHDARITCQSTVAFYEQCIAQRRSRQHQLLPN